MNAIEITGLVKRFKTKTAVKGLDLSIKEGEFFSLLGVNGAGKTTTIRMLSCLTQPTEGDALLLGHSIVKEPQAVKSLINVSPQETAVAPNLTVRENLEMVAGLYGATRAEAKKTAQAVLEEMNLTEFAGSKSKILSGGWQRRLSIAMAMISEPKILFLDEPTLGLDVLARRELWREIEKLKGKVTVILTTHYLEEAEALSDRIAVMVGAELKAAAGTDNFEDAFVALAEGKMNK